ncbi:MAG: choice-of-anchor M domain-containing protein [Pseudonocardiaceae bacterium]
MSHRNLIVVAGACLAAVILTAPSVLADPAGPPDLAHRPLNGVGSPVTEALMNALSEVIVDSSGNKLISSWDTGPAGSPITTGSSPVCTVIRPANSAEGRIALRRSLINGPASTPDGCLQFVRSYSAEMTEAGPSLSLRRFALDGVSYAARDDGSVPLDLTPAQLRAIYDCAPGNEAYRPMLPGFGSEIRLAFVSLILGQADTPELAATRPCITEVSDAGGPLPENDGRVLTSPGHLVPYSVAQYHAQVNKVILDVHGRGVLGAPGAITPSLPHAAHGFAGISYVTRDNSSIPADLSAAELRDIYRCDPAFAGARPLLPASGALRETFITEVLGGVAPGPCVGTIPAENDGTLLTGEQHLAPYSIEQYHQQVNRKVADRHGRTVLGSINAVSPTVLNPAQPATRAILTAFPTSQEPLPPTSTVFTGPGSLICQQTAVITRYGFGTLPPGLCGTQAIATGHFEIDMDYAGDTLILDLRDEMSNPLNDNVPPAEAILVLQPSARRTIPSEPGFGCLGAPGAPVYFIPQSPKGNEITGAFDTTDIRSGVLRDNKVAIELVGWSTPPGAHFAAYNSSFSGPLFRFNTNPAPGCQATIWPDGGIINGNHVHTWYAFSAAGTYTLTFRARATTIDGVPKVSDDQTYTFVVG